MKNIAVIEFGTSKITVLCGKKGINGNFSIAGIFDTPYAGYYDGEFVEEENLVDAVRVALDKAEGSLYTHIEKIYVGVPASFSVSLNAPFSKIFAQKTRIDENVLNAIYEENNNYKDISDYVLISCSPVTAILDDGNKVHNLVGQKALKVSGELNYIYSDKLFINLINNALKVYGVDTVEYISSPLAEALYLLSDEKREVPHTIIDCGYITTSVAVTQGRGLTLLGSFSVGGGQITSDLSQCLDISYKEAENVKQQLMLSIVPNQTDVYNVNKIDCVLPISMKKANDIVCSRLDMICSLINKCLSKDPNFVKGQVLYLTGGGISFIKGAKDYLSKMLGVNIEILVPPDINYQKPNYSEVFGLLDFSIKKESNNKVGFLSNLKNFFRKK